MPRTHRRFDPFLNSIRADELKPMARTWGGHSQMRKAECIEAIRRGLSNPDQVRAVLSKLKPFERTALALAKQMSGEIEAGALAVALHASGVELPHSRSPHGRDTTTLIQPLVRRGLFISKTSHNPAYVSSSFGRIVLFSDERLLAHVGPPECHPFFLKPVAPPPTSIYRRPPTVVLDIIGILQAIDDMGGLRLTKSETIRANARRRLARAMGWQKDQIEVDGLPFPNPGLALASAFRHSGLLSLQGNTLVLKEATDQFATRPYAEQVGRLLYGFVQVGGWDERRGTPSRYDPERDRRVRGRLALTLALMALPVDTDGFFAIDDLDEAIFRRIGEHFSLGYGPHHPYYFNKTPEEIRQAEGERLTKLRADWLARERPWIESALSTWLYYLGLIELGMQDGALVSIRLTDLGRAVLHPELEVSLEAPAGEPQAAWIVQPNFDVVVYLDRTTPEQLAFLERHAERVQAQQHTAHYRLTRESVYQGLESGTSLDDLLAGLQAGAGADLPQNVVVSIREWGALRERITLHRRARLLEFADAQARQAAIQAGVAGTPVGKRFLLLTTPELAPHWIAQRVDYAHPLPKCLMVSEDGVIGLKHPAGDLFIEAQLDRWAERKSSRMWRLTAASVTAAIQAGAKLGELFALLQERLTRPLPALLGVALRAWAGETHQIEVATVTVLRCAEPAVFQAIATSPKLSRYLRGQLAPDILVVDTRQVETLKEQLAWAGLEVVDGLVR